MQEGIARCIRKSILPAGRQTDKVQPPCPAKEGLIQNTVSDD